MSVLLADATDLNQWSSRRDARRRSAPGWRAAMLGAWEWAPARVASASSAPTETVHDPPSAYRREAEPRAFR
jgi:hypothetical protein